MALKLSDMKSICLLSIPVIFAIIISVANLSHQFVAAANNVTMQQHVVHITDNLIVSQHIPLTGSLFTSDYILLMDLTPFATSVEGHRHIAMKIPCNEDGTPKATIVTGVAPNLNSLDIGNAINNGSLNGKHLDLSAKGKSCLYDADITNPPAKTDVVAITAVSQRG